MLRHNSRWDKKAWAPFHLILFSTSFEWVGSHLHNVLCNILYFPVVMFKYAKAWFLVLGTNFNYALQKKRMKLHQVYWY